MSAPYQDLNDYAKLLHRHIKIHGDSFKSKNGYIECDLGGYFLPTCGEMEIMAGYNQEDELSSASFHPGEPVVLKMGQPLFFPAPPNCCYYEFIKSATHISRIFLRIKAYGYVEITIRALFKDKTTVVQRSLHDFGPTISEWETEPIGISLLPSIGLLMLSVRSYSPEAVVTGFRWIGLVPENKANIGERIYLIRTYGNKALVSSVMRSLADSLSASHPDILKRSIFIIYDATSDNLEAPVGPLTKNLRILEFAGPNCGGGGNASLMFSLMLRLPEASQKAIANIVLIDDDARMDVDAIVREDGFATAAKNNVISAAVIYKSEDPTVIQEYGAIWGRFFNKNVPSLHTAPEYRGRTIFPILPRYGWNLHKPGIRQSLARPAEADYGTFIFISFPWELVHRIGAPFPFFLRNDDVEICLRAVEAGAKLLINPNLFVWHTATHSPIAEFYAVLHGLIVNSAYDWLDKAYTLEYLANKVAALARAGNMAMLAAYMHALERFAAGPAWMQGSEVFSEYQDIRNELKRLVDECCYEVPREAVDRNKGIIHIFNLLESHPPRVDKETILFIDEFTNIYYAQRTDNRADLLTACLKALGFIGENFETLTSAWRKCLRGFDHLNFWNQILTRDGLEFQFERLGVAPATTGPTEKEEVDVRRIKELADAILPPGFTEEGYLRKNPDVRESGMPAAEHWLKYGKKEKRQY